jgi:hypothetical protein
VDRPERKQGSTCTSKVCLKSKKRSCKEFTEEQRKEIYDCFWQKLDWDQKKTYVSGLVRKTETAVPKKGKSRRIATYEYFLRSTDGERKQVCKTMFLSTLGIGEWTVHRWTTDGGDSGTHQSSIHKQRNPIPAHKKQLTEEFVNSLPKLPSHYCRKDSEKLYLETTIDSWSKLTKLFHEFCDSRGVARVSRTILRRVAKSMNVALCTPKKDACNVCTSYEFGHCTKDEYDTHMKRDKEAKQAKKEDKRLAEDDDTIVVTTMDLQIVLLAPKIFANAQYYKTKLACHNFTIYELASHRCVCYFWDETKGELAADSFASCVEHFIKDLLSTREGVRTIILYSDGCCYQNRNSTLSNCLLNLAIWRYHRRKVDGKGTYFHGSRFLPFTFGTASEKQTNLLAS